MRKADYDLYYEHIESQPKDVEGLREIELSQVLAEKHNPCIVLVTRADNR